MKKWKKITVFILTAFMSGFFASQSFASNDIVFRSIDVLNIGDGKATIKWVTDKSTKGTVYFGSNVNDLSRKTGYSRYDQRHEIVLTGLEKKKTYYFKIVAIDQAQNQKEAYVQSFSTKEMERTELVKPVFLEQKVLQTTSNAVALSWKTNEETNAVVYYWIEDSDFDKAKKRGIKSFRTSHEIFIYKLLANKRYHFRIEAKDRSGNMSSKYFSVNTHSYSDKDLELKISSIVPLSFERGNIFPRRVVIELKTNLVTRVYVRYGTTPGKYKKKSVIPQTSSRDHKITISDLEPNTTYYYQIRASNGLYKKKFASRGMSFITAPLTNELKSGTLVQGSDFKVYVISGTEKLWIKTAEIFSKLGYKWDWIQRVDSSILNEYKEGRSIKKANRYLDGTLVKYPFTNAVYLIESGRIRPFSSAEEFIRGGYDWNKVITMPKRTRYKIGEYL